MFSVFSMKKKDLLKLNSNFQPELCSAEINWLQSVGRSLSQLLSSIVVGVDIRNDCRKKRKKKKRKRLMMIVINFAQQLLLLQLRFIWLFIIYYRQSPLLCLPKRLPLSLLMQKILHLILKNCCTFFSCCCRRFLFCVWFVDFFSRLSVSVCVCVFDYAINRWLI